MLVCEMFGCGCVSIGRYLCTRVSSVCLCVPCTQCTQCTVYTLVALGQLLYLPFTYLRLHLYVYLLCVYVIKWVYTENTFNLEWRIVWFWFRPLVKHMYPSRPKPNKHYQHSSQIPHFVSSPSFNLIQIFRRTLHQLYQYYLSQIQICVEIESERMRVRFERE